jgi:hypothetical protein
MGKDVAIKGYVSWRVKSTFQDACAALTAFQDACAAHAVAYGGACVLKSRQMPWVDVRGISGRMRCVCGSIRRLGPTHARTDACAKVCIYIYIYIYVYICMYMYMHICICICIYVCMLGCVCVCVCVKTNIQIYMREHECGEWKISIIVADEIRMTHVLYISDQ